MIIMAFFLGALLTSCASQDMVKKGEMDAKIPINCASAEADIRVLESEKTHASEQLATGVTYRSSWSVYQCSARENSAERESLNRRL